MMGENPPETCGLPHWELSLGLGWRGGRKYQTHWGWDGLIDKGVVQESEGTSPGHKSKQGGARQGEVLGHPWAAFICPR